MKTERLQPSLGVFSNLLLDDVKPEKGQIVSEARTHTYYSLRYSPTTSSNFFEIVIWTTS